MLHGYQGVILKKVALLCLFGLLIIASSISAQDATPTASPCGLDALHGLIDRFATAITDLQTSKETDPAKLSNALQEMANNANVVRAVCDGLTFSGKKQQVIGPITIPEGFYRVKATTTGPIIVNATITDGECERRTSGEEKGLFALQKGEATDGTEVVFTSKGCTVLIEISLIRADWTLAFERITTQ